MMRKHGRLKAGWQGNDADIKIDVFVFSFIDENDVHYNVVPALDIIGYGKSERAADASLKIMISEYLDYTSKNNTLEKDLKKHGWKIKQGSNAIRPPDIAQLISKNQSLNSLMTERDFSKKTKSIRIPAFA